MDLHRIQKITIAYLDFQDLTNHRMGNPVAEDELPELLRKAIKTGVYVEIADPNGIDAYRLTLDQNEQFQIVPRV
jgi:hypothetical protein